MFNTLIATVEQADGHGGAVGVAASLGRLGRLPLEILSVVAPGDRNGGGTDVEWRPLQDDRSAVTIVGGDVGASIVDHVQDRDGALLIMDTSAVGLVSGLRHSVTARVLAALRQPVLLLGPRVPTAVPLAAPTLVVGAEHHEGPPPALSVIGAWQRTFGGHRPCVVEVVAPTGWPSGSSSDRLDRAYVHPLARMLADQGTLADSRLLRAFDPVDALIRLAGPIEDPVFVVTSERWAGGSSLWYSTTRQLVRWSSRPVLVVPADLATDWSGGPQRPPQRSPTASPSGPHEQPEST